MGLFDKFKSKKNTYNDKIDILAKEGNLLYESGNLDGALKKYLEGYDIISEPKNLYSESSWFEVAIGDIYFDKKQFDKAIQYYEKAKGNIAGNGVNNPYILFKYGACAYRLNNKTEANEFLLRAYMLSGNDIFKSYDSEYFEFLKQNNRDVK